MPPNDISFRQTREAADHLDAHLATSIAVLAPAEAAQAAPSPPKEKAVSITGLGGTGGTIKQMLVEHKAQMTNLIEGHVADLNETLVKQRAAVGAFGRMVSSARAETDDFLADLGQFTNDLGI